MTLLPAIVEKTELLTDRLDSFANYGHEFSLQSLATNLTFDVIGRLVLDVDMASQSHVARRGVQVLTASYGVGRPNL